MDQNTAEDTNQTSEVLFYSFISANLLKTRFECLNNLGPSNLLVSNNLLIQLFVSGLGILSLISLCKLRQRNCAIQFFYAMAIPQVLLRVCGKIAMLHDDCVKTGEAGALFGCLAYGLFLTCCLTQILITYHLFLVIEEYQMGTLGVAAGRNGKTTDKKLVCIDTIALPIFLILGIPLMIQGIPGFTNSKNLALQQIYSIVLFFSIGILQTIISARLFYRLNQGDEFIKRAMEKQTTVLKKVLITFSISYICAGILSIVLTWEILDNAAQFSADVCGDKKAEWAAYVFFYYIFCEQLPLSILFWYHRKCFQDQILQQDKYLVGAHEQAQTRSHSPMSSSRGTVTDYAQPSPSNQTSNASIYLTGSKYVDQQSTIDGDAQNQNYDQMQASQNNTMDVTRTLSYNYIVSNAIGGKQAPEIWLNQGTKNAYEPTSDPYRQSDQMQNESQDRLSPMFVKSLHTRPVSLQADSFASADNKESLLAEK